MKQKIKSAHIISNIKIVRHRSATSIVNGFVSGMTRRTKRVGRRFIDKGGFQAGVTDQFGNNWEISSKDFYGGVKNSGIWGYADYQKKQIHFWATKEISKNVLIKFFGHELGHFSGKQFKNILLEEDKAEEFSSVAMTASALANKYHK